MKVVELKNPPFTAKFAPNQGMNLLSFQKDEIEVIDQKTYPLFEERFAGLGALIGPHFHHRKPFEIPLDFTTSLFPHIQKVKKKGVVEPFSHGIARYVPWKYQASSTQISATLCSSDTAHGIPLRKLEGFDFSLHLEATLMPWGLFFRYSVESEKPSIIGFHTYYALDEKPAEVIFEGEKILIEGDFDQNFSYKNPLEENRIILNTSRYSLHLLTLCPSYENSWQLYHPQDASFVCIEPLSAKNPRAPIHTSSHLEVKLEIY